MPSVTLRPSADVTIEHNKYENGSTSKAAAYTLIDDVVSDEDATTIGQKHHSTSVTSKTSTFKLGGATYNHKIFIDSIEMHYDYFCENPAKYGKMTSVAISTAVSVKGMKSSPLKNTIADVNTESDSGGYKVLSSTFTPSNFDALTSPYESISDLELEFDITTEWKCGSGSVTQDQSMFISQVYAVVNYTDAYTFTAVGNETTDAISPGVVKDETMAYFEATPKINHRFLGWYSDSACTNQVSTSQSYGVRVNGSDETFYANSKRIEAINVYYKKNGQWQLVKELFIKENGRYRTLTAQEFGNALYFSDKSYINNIH